VGRAGQGVCVGFDETLGKMPGIEILPVFLDRS
jgi:hypothetical protein